MFDRLKKLGNLLRPTRRPTSGGAGKWHNVSIRIKLPLAFVGFSVASILSIVLVSAMLSRTAQLDAADAAFEVAVANRAAQITQWLETAQATLRTTSQGKQVIDALYSMSSAFNDIQPNAKEVLQKAYITDNPNPAGQRQVLQRAEGDEFYHAEHAKFHRTFVSILQEYHFYDIFLINRDGDIVYTVVKEADFSDNLRAGELANSSLAKVYDLAMQAKPGEVFLSNYEPYAPSAGAHAIFMATPIVSELGVTVGVLAVQLPETGLIKAAEASVLLGESTEVYVVTQNLTAMTQSRFEGGFGLGEKVQELPQITQGWATKTGAFKQTPLQSGQTGIAHTITLNFGGNAWLLVAERDYPDILAYFYSQLELQIWAALASLALVGALGWWVAGGFAKPIAALNASIQSVAAGQYDVTVPFTANNDEIGDIAKSIEEMRGNLIEARALQAERAARQSELANVVDELTSAMQGLANGDLSKTIDAPFADAYEILRNYFNDTVQKMSQSIKQIALAAEGMSAQSNELTRAAEDLAHRTEVQAATLEQTAAAMDEMTASVKSASVGIREVDDIVVQARKDADDCGIVVKEAVSAMAEIEKSSDQIGQIIGAIDDIAFQTNLLALNAGVEAARAGEAGRGFAVVALEVGALAQRASTAAKEIKSLIGTSTEHVERGVVQVKQAGSALQQIAQRVTQISSLTTTIATGAAEQVLGLNEINVGVIQLDQATQKNAAMAEQASAASQMMVSGTQELAALVGRFKLPSSEPIPMPSLTQFLPEASAHRPQLDEASSAGDAANTPNAPSSSAKSGVVDEFDAPTSRPLRAANAAARGVWQDF